MFRVHVLLHPQKVRRKDKFLWFHGGTQCFPQSNKNSFLPYHSLSPLNSSSLGKRSCHIEMLFFPSECLHLPVFPNLNHHLRPTSNPASSEQGHLHPHALGGTSSDCYVHWGPHQWLGMITHCFVGFSFHVVFLTFSLFPLLTFLSRSNDSTHFRNSIDCVRNTTTKCSTGSNFYLEDILGLIE